MKFIETVNELISKKEIQEESIDFLEDIIKSLLGNPISTGKIIISLVKSPAFIREKLFWSKFEMFLNGIYLSEDDCNKLCHKLTRDGEKEDNCQRLLSYIDKAETQKKIGYLINATRYLIMNFIDLSTYFRICHAIVHTLEEDLQFLKENINKTEFSWNLCVQGLLTTGLMYQSVFDGNGEQKYSFTPTAKLIDQFALSCDNINRYPNIGTIQIEETPLTMNILHPNLEDMMATDEDIDKMLNEVFGK